MAKHNPSRCVVVRAACLALALSVGCSEDDPRGNEAPKGVEPAASSLQRTTTPSTSGVPALGASNRAFAFDLYHSVAEKNSGRNLIFSPHSVSTALAMTYEGARGTTEREMKETLHFDLDKPLLHEAFNATDLALSGRGAGKAGADGTPFRLTVNNSLWAQRDYPIVPAYLDVLALQYGSGVFLTDFAGAPEPSRKAINSWVENKTEQLIPELLPMGSIHGSTVFVLTNTVYFNAGWATKFEEHDTRNQPFTKLDGTQVSASTMHAALFVPYAEGPDYRAVAIPYQSDELRFIAVLPNDGAFAKVETSLSAAWFEQLRTQWKDTSLEVGLPELDYKQHTSLKEQLQALGMNAAFGGDADFSGMTSGGVFIDDVIHEAVLKVFEGGTIAAAATAVILDESAASTPDQRIQFDRPFLLAIVDEPTGAVLFLGRVLDPTVK